MDELKAMLSELRSSVLCFLGRGKNSMSADDVIAQSDLEPTFYLSFKNVRSVA